MQHFKKYQSTHHLTTQEVVDMPQGLLYLFIRKWENPSQLGQWIDFFMGKDLTQQLEEECKSLKTDINNSYEVVRIRAFKNLRRHHA